MVGQRAIPSLPLPVLLKQRGKKRVHRLHRCLFLRCKTYLYVLRERFPLACRNISMSGYVSLCFGWAEDRRSRSTLRYPRAQQLLKVSRGKTQLHFGSDNSILHTGTWPWGMKTQLKHDCFILTLPGGQSDALGHWPVSPTSGKSSNSKEAKQWDFFPWLLAGGTGNPWRPPRKHAAPLAGAHTSAVAVIPSTSTFEIITSTAYEITHVTDGD